MPSWLSKAVFYEIYPQSFYDSNDDGIGDIPGIIEKLDYIKSLGFNAIWINPCFESPFDDAGYDVSDYYKVADRYGTNADLKKLFKEAHKLDIKVCLDLVPGHTSMEHAWFKESAKAQKNEYTNRYVWTDNVWDQDTGGMTGINGFGNRNGRYITNFFYTQPALNYGFAKPEKNKPWQLPVDHPDSIATREELKNIMSFWLDMGADGFRVDMASSLVKNDPGWKETSKLWQNIRQSLSEKYPEAVLISEWGSPAAAVKAGFHIDFMLHFHDPAYTALLRQEPVRDCFGVGTDPGNSIFDAEGKGNVSVFMDSFMSHYKSLRKKGYISIPSGNHDISRLNTERSLEELKVAMTFILTQPGVPFIYYGDEIGMRYIPGLDSKEGGYGRTGSRTPMQWSGKKNKGFSNAPASELYLPVDKDRSAPTVTSCMRDKDSLLHTVKQLIELRNSSEALSADGGFTPLFAKKKKYPLVYMRNKGREKFIVALNPTKNETSASFDIIGKGDTEPVFVEGVEIKAAGKKMRLKMQPFSYGIFSLV
ncbi:MAG: alpha-amylase family glycosyl hydrolase [Sedimentisphaeraceae bacterium JB056]